MSISEIASQRDFTYSTIVGHLATFLTTGEIELFDLISEKKFLKIKNKISKVTFDGLNDLKSKLGDKFSYSELRFTLNDLKNDSK